jgi:DNA-binding IclR family transcriptional regulator
MPDEGARSSGRQAGEPGDGRGSALQRSFALLEAVVAEARPISLAQLAETLALPKPTVHRLAARLETDGFLARDPATRNFVVGPRLNALAVATLTAAAGRAPHHAVLDALAAETGETCNLGMLDGGQVVYLDRVESQWPLRLQLSVGSRVPLHCTAMGKLFLAHMTARARERLYEAAPLQRYTERTITDPVAMERAAETIRADGVAINDQEYMVGMVGMAVGVPDPTRKDRFIAALAVNAPEVRLPAADIRKHLPAMREAAKRLSALFGEPA